MYKYLSLLLFINLFEKTFSQTFSFEYDSIGNRVTQKLASSVPIQPKIIYNNNNLTASSGPSYQWYFNNSPIGEAVNSVINISQEGRYNVQAKNGACFSLMSDTFVTSHYVFTGNGAWSIDSNWKFRYNPPLTLTNLVEIIIDPMPNGISILTGQLRLQPNSKVIVQPGKKLEIKNQ